MIVLSSRLQKTDKLDKVSIVLPTHNGSKYLRESIDSCLNQSYSNIELILVDDGSTDETPTIIQSVSDPRVAKLGRETNRGLPTALNTGFARATGEYLTWTSDDNLYAPEAIEVLVGFLAQRLDVDFVYADYWQINEHGQIIGQIEVGPTEALVERDCVGACFLYRRAVYESVGEYNLQACPAEDYEYWLRVARQFRMEPYHKCLYYYRVHSRSLTGRHRWYPADRAAARAKLNLGWIDRSQYLSSLAKIDICEAFDKHAQGDLANVRHFIIRALRKDLSHLTNRGVLSIFLESLIGPRWMCVVRSVTGRFAPGG